MKRIKKIKHRVAALLLSMILAAGLVAQPLNFRVYASAPEVINGSCTIADMVMAYYASAGLTIVNQEVINSIYNYLGESLGTIQSYVDSGALTVVNNQYVDSGLSEQIAPVLQNVQGVNLDYVFQKTAEQSATGTAVPASSVLAGIAGSVATTGVLPIAVGVGAEAYAGFQLGTLLYNVIENPVNDFLDKIYAGVPLNIPNDLSGAMANMRSGATGIITIGAFMHTYSCDQGLILCLVNVNGSCTGYIYNPTANPLIRTFMNSSNNFSPNTSTIASGRDQNVFNNLNESNVKSWGIVFESGSDYNNAKQMWSMGNNLPNTQRSSPDVIGSDGNIQAQRNPDTGKITLPGVTPQVDPATSSVDPNAMTFQDWIDLANRVLDNNRDPSPVPDANKDLYGDILGRIVIPGATPTPTPNPNPNPNPDHDPDPGTNPNPETVPRPSYNPYPDNYPVPDPENVPQDRPQPQYTEKQSENETDITEGDPYTTPNLLDKFPFCIPRDILKIFKKLDSGSRQAPHIEWTFNPNSMIDYTFDIDFAIFDNVASLLRLLELLAFIIALGIATRNLILS